MSRARKTRKANRCFEYEITDRLGELVVSAFGFDTERRARIGRMWDKQYERVGDWIGPAPGVKYHVPRGAYVQYKGRKQLPRDYYSRR